MTEQEIIEAYTKHCFTDRNLKPVNIKKKNEEIYNVFESLLENWKGTINELDK